MKSIAVLMMLIFGGYFVMVGYQGNAEALVSYMTTGDSLQRVAYALIAALFLGIIAAIPDGGEIASAFILLIIVAYLVTKSGSSALTDLFNIPKEI